MERQDQEHAQQPGQGQQGPKDISERIAALERMLSDARSSLEQAKEAPGQAVRSALEAAQAEREKQAQQEAGEEKAEERPEPEEEQKAGEEAQPPSGEEQREPEEEQPEEEAQAPSEEEQREPEEQQPEEEAEAPSEEEEREPEKKRGKEEKAVVTESAVLLDGSGELIKSWKKVGSGELDFRDEQLQLRPGNDRGLAYYSDRRFDDFRLTVQYKLDKPDTPMSLAFRFLDPDKPVPDRDHPERKYRYDNQAYVAAHTGYEVSLGRGLGTEPGTLVGVPVGDGEGQQSHPESAELKEGDWNEIELEARGNDFKVRLNGKETARFTNNDSYRAKLAASGPDAGYVGILMGEQPRARRTGALPGQLAGPMVPTRRAAKAQAGAPGLAIRRIEVQVLASKAKTEEEKKRRARKELEALHQEVFGALAHLKAKHKELEEVLQKAYGYAVLPAVARASLVVGAARGYGEVFEQGKPIGFTRVTQLTVGVQVGGQTFTQLIIFGSKGSLEAFKSSPLAFSGNASALFIRGGSGMTDFKDVTAHAYTRGGMLLEASLGGQRFRFLKEQEAIEALAKSMVSTGAKEKVANAGRKVASLAGKLTSKVASRKPKGLAGRLTSRANDFLKRHGAE
jgi:hypothetical protein